MTSAIELSTIGDVRALLDEVDPDGRLVPCGISTLRLGRDAVSAVGPVVAELLAARGREADAEIVLLVDGTRIARRGADFKTLVADRLPATARVRRVVLSDGHPELHVSEDVVADAVRAVAGADLVVAVGGGTIGDIGKLAADRAGGLPLVVVQTAASVDGFTDNVSVLIRGGVKRTVPSRWPDAVIADTEVIAEAPARMNRAGYGEMTSMFTAPADWRLAALCGLDATFHPGPLALLDVVGRDIAEWSPGVGRDELAAVERLVAALAFRGIATGVAGTTACLSGVEHLVSHLLDLHHSRRHLPMGLHGAQVGVAAVVAAAAWDLVLDRLAAGPPPPVAAAVLDEDAARAQVEQAFAELDPTGGIAAECWSDYAKKLQTCHRGLDGINAVVAGWSDHRTELRALVRPAAALGQGLRAANVPATFAELDPPIDAGLARWAVEHCALMRNRFTVVDLLTLLGWWTADDVSEVLARAAAATPPAAAPARPAPGPRRGGQRCRVTM